MKIVVATDKFKSTFTSQQINDLIFTQLKKFGFNNIEKIAVSDGGQGFLDCIEQKVECKKIALEVKDPLFRTTKTYYLQYGDTAFIESSKIIGIDMLSDNEKNPMLTSSYGIGEAILNAIWNGSKNIFVGLGGSATNDAGMGMANALGINFYNNSTLLYPIGKNLIKINKIDYSKAFDLSHYNIIGLCDVENPLFGLEGAAYCYAKQKGAQNHQIEILDNGLKNIFNLIRKQDIFEEQKFYGAAGGLGFGLKFFANAQLSSGADYLINFLNVEEKIKDADLLITGEGMLDKQSFDGKIVGKLINIAQKYKKPSIVICGQNRLSTDNDICIISLFEQIINIKQAQELTPQKISQIDFSREIKKIFE